MIIIGRPIKLNSYIPDIQWVLTYFKIHIELLLCWCLINPLFSFQCVPYLIAMGTDPEPAMRNKADQQLVEIDKKYAGFIHVCIF